MVLTKSELIASLQNEVRILLHLATKIDRAKLDYRPMPKQRSTIELLKYLSMMGPALTQFAVAGTFDASAWTAAQQAADARDFDETLAALAAHTNAYATLLAGVSDAALRADIQGGGNQTTRGAFLVNSVLGASIAYRMQLFLYLKASGREELNTWNLVSRPYDSSHNSRAGHPGWLRCSALKYSRYSRASRLAIQAPRSGIYATNHTVGTLGAGADAPAAAAVQTQ